MRETLKSQIKQFDDVGFLTPIPDCAQCSLTSRLANRRNGSMFSEILNKWQLSKSKSAQNGTTLDTSIQKRLDKNLGTVTYAYPIGAPRNRGCSLHY